MEGEGENGEWEETKEQECKESMITNTENEGSV